MSMSIKQTVRLVKDYNFCKKHISLVNRANQALEQIKYEIAAEFGVNLGGDTASRLNGSVGGEMTKRLVAYAEQSLSGRK